VRHHRLNKVILDKLVTNGEVESQHAIDDMVHRVRLGVRTTFYCSSTRRTRAVGQTVALRSRAETSSSFSTGIPAQCRFLQ